MTDGTAERSVYGMRATDWRALIGRRIKLNTAPDPHRGYYNSDTGTLLEVIGKNLSLDGNWVYATRYKTFEVLDEVQGEGAENV